MTVGDMENEDIILILKKELGEDLERDLYETFIYAYMAGRFPELTIKRAFDIVTTMKKELMQEE